MKIIVAFALLATVSGCKFNSSKSESNTKDFAANANGPNFALIAAFLPEEMPGQSGIDPQGNNSGFIKDLYNWNNLFARKILGTYNISMYSTTQMNPNTKSTDIIKAFEAIAPQLNKDSTIVFTFTGRTSGGKMRLADGLFNFGQLVAPLKGKPGKRFYFLSDAADINPAINTNALLIDANSTGAKDLAFPEVVEFSAHSRPSASVSGRLAVEFSGVLDAMERTNPQSKLGEFFRAVVAATAKNPTGPATYRVSSAGIETETLLSAANLPAKAAVSAPQAAGPMATPVPGAAAKYVLLEVSMVGCGPCKTLAEEIGGMSLPGCTVKTVIGSGDPKGWTEYAGAAASKHLVSPAENTQYQSKYGISNITSFPQLLLIDAATDQVVSQNAQGDYASKCGGTGGGSAGGGGIGTWTPPGGGGSSGDDGSPDGEDGSFDDNDPNDLNDLNDQEDEDF